MDNKCSSVMNNQCNLSFILIMWVTPLLFTVLDGVYQSFDWTWPPNDLNQPIFGPRTSTPNPATSLTLRPSVTSTISLRPLVTPIPSDGGLRPRRIVILDSPRRVPRVSRLRL